MYRGMSRAEAFKPVQNNPFERVWAGTDLDMKENWHHKYQNKMSSEWVSKRD